MRIAGIWTSFSIDADLCGSAIGRLRREICFYFYTVDFSIYIIFLLYIHMSNSFIVFLHKKKKKKKQFHLDFFPFFLDKSVTLWIVVVLIWQKLMPVLIYSLKKIQKIIFALTWLCHHRTRETVIFMNVILSFFKFHSNICFFPFFFFILTKRICLMCDLIIYINIEIFHIYI